jgi:hypothetical protein
MSSLRCQNVTNWKRTDVIVINTTDRTAAVQRPGIGDTAEPEEEVLGCSIG